MSAHPILFSASMVRAIQAGTKTQTRRVVSAKIVHHIESICGNGEEVIPSTDIGLTWGRPQVENARGRYRELKHPEWMIYGTEYPDEGSIRIGKGYGAVGDRLWVRETWSANPRRPHGAIPKNPTHCLWRADADIEQWRWSPSIFMPRWASRISLEITGVRIERLKDISVDDAIAEGLKAITKDGKTVKYGIPDRDGMPGEDDLGWPWHLWRISPVDAYEHLWESINGPESWAENPWVWVIEFKRLEASESAVAA